KCKCKRREHLVTVRAIDLLKSKKGQNRQEHHTDRYHSDQLIVRRGQTFQMWIEFSRSFDPKTDNVHLELKLGPNPVLSKSTLVIVPLVDELHNNCWESKITEKKDNKIKLSINSLPTAAIGRYELTVVTQSPSGNTTSPRNPDNDIYILFNPWCEDDAVYMDSEEQRNEYVLNDQILIIHACICVSRCGQFADGMLAACLFMLECSKTPASGWGDPVNVARVVSAMVNSPDENGVLEGNWSGEYSDGTSPTAWSGSVDIVKQYHKSGGTPVKYGQCWVFSGVTTTVLRCLGIPSRSITNFDSAHDTDVSMTIDVYLDENLMPINDLNTDSVWNFHVWNDCWMSRPDLPAGMGGWQAVDATPQETSQGMYCCGPASVAAVRNGQVYLKYDAPFVFAEVNSDKIYWKRNTDGTFSQIHCEKNVVGHCISTKAVGSDNREDITHDYKYPEGSKEERIAVETATCYGSRPDTYASAVTKDVTIEITMNGEGPKMGEDAELAITIKNSSSELRSVSLYSELAVMYYTGVNKATVQKDNMQIDLKANEGEHLCPWWKVLLLFKAAIIKRGWKLLGPENLTSTVYLNMFACASVLQPVGKPVVGKEMSAEFTFKNPLPHVLKNVKFRIEGLGLQSAREIAYGLATVTLTERFVPTLAGPRKLLASLDCKQLTQVHGVADVFVREN
uniref:Protein-glutamine gamma-glutamyltransferase K n=1 Tax=Electrophorus electricus TaxID=8005 RepID=A0A4W4FM86_ELEEL